MAARSQRNHGVRPIGGNGLAGIAAVVATSAATGVFGQDGSTISASRQLGGERELFVEVGYGAGALAVLPAAAGSLYRLEIQYDQDVFEPHTEYDNGRLEIGMDRVGRDIRFGSGNGRGPGELELELTREIPLYLDLEFGAVRADLELGGLSILGLDLETGASDTRIEVSEPNPVGLEQASFEVGAANFVANGLGNLNAETIHVAAKAGRVALDFTGEWRRSADVQLELKLGAAQLRFPRGLGVKLVHDAMLTSVDAQEMVRRGREYTSLNWDDAEIRITVEADTDIGAIEVVWIR